MGGEDQAVSEDQETEEPGMLELTGEERTIPLSEDTEVVEISMGGRPEGEEPPEGQEPSFYGVGAAILANERGWGQEGNNGSDCSFTAISQEMEGDVIWDSISSLYSQGQILDENGNSVSIVGSDGTTYVEGDSSYTVTVDSYENTVDLTEAAESASWDDDQVEQPQML